MTPEQRYKAEQLGLLYEELCLVADAVRTDEPWRRVDRLATLIAKYSAHDVTCMMAVLIEDMTPPEDARYRREHGGESSWEEFADANDEDLEAQLIVVSLRVGDEVELSHERPDRKHLYIKRIA